jgi:hypothetical protein
MHATMQRFKSALPYFVLVISYEGKMFMKGPPDDSVLAVAHGADAERQVELPQLCGERQNGPAGHLTDGDGEKH